MEITSYQPWVSLGFWVIFYDTSVYMNYANMSHHHLINLT